MVPSTTIEFNYCIRIEQSRCTTRDTKHRAVRVNFATDAPWVKGKGEIKKASLHFVEKFWWVMVQHRVDPKSADNILTWDRAW